jgi:phosphonate transport system substrate-binding protein
MKTCCWLGMWLYTLSLAAAQATDCTQPEVLHVGGIPKNASRADAQRQASLLRVLREETGLPVQWVPAASYAAVVERMLAGKAHIAELGPASYAMLRQRSERFAPFAAFSDTDTLSQYHSVLVVHADSPAQTLQDLRGKAVALTDPASTSGAVVPRWAILQMTGYEPEHFFGRVIYTGAHDKALAALHAGKVQAAFVASHQMDAKHGRVLWRSAPLVASPYVWDTQLCPDVQKAIRRTFLERSAQIQPWLATKNYRNMVPVSPSDYAAIEALVQGASKR